MTTDMWKDDACDLARALIDIIESNNKDPGIIPAKLYHSAISILEKHVSLVEQVSQDSSPLKGIDPVMASFIAPFVKE